MVFRLCRTIGVVGLITTLVWASAIPQDHVHEADHDHPQSIVHRHLEAHSFESHDHDAAEVGQDGERVVWLSNVSLDQSTFSFSPGWSAVVLPFEAIPESATWVAVTSYDASPPHGPPRPRRSSRAPPRLSA